MPLLPSYLWNLEFYTFLMSSFPPPPLDIGEALISPQQAPSSPSSLSSQFRESLHVASEGQQSPKMASRPHHMSPSNGFARNSSVRFATSFHLNDFGIHDLSLLFHPCVFLTHMLRSLTHTGNPGQFTYFFSCGDS